MSPTELGAADAGPVLAVFTHPDDAEIGAGATLAKWADAGRDITLLILTDGSKGSQDPNEDREKLVRLRRDEQREGALRLGLARVEFFDRVDGELENTLELRSDLVRVIRRLRPRVVVCPDPTSWFFGSQYYNHRDHRQTGEAVLDAISPAAGNPHFFAEQLAEGLKPWNVPEMWLGPTMDANHVEDVSGFVETKIAALEAHASQLAGDQLGFFKQWIPAEAEEEGKKIGAAAGESFRVLRFE